MKRYYFLLMIGLLWSASTPATCRGFNLTPNTLRFMGGLGITSGGDFGNDMEFFNLSAEGSGIKLNQPGESLHWALALEHRVIPTLAFGLEGQFDIISSQDYVVNQGRRSEAISSGSTYAVLANVIITPIPSGAGVYMGAGAGLAYAHIKDTIREDGSLDIGVKASAWAPTVQAFLGFSIPVGSMSSMGVQWGYRFYQAPIKDGVATLDGREYQSFELSDDEFNFDLSGPMVSVMLGHRF